jgi:hypothetical protein
MLFYRSIDFAIAIRKYELTLDTSDFNASRSLESTVLINDFFIGFLGKISLFLEDGMISNTEPTPRINATVLDGRTGILAGTTF